MTLTGFIAGSTLATFHMPFWWSTPSLGSIALSRHLGWFAAMGVQLAVFAFIAWFSWQLERRRSAPTTSQTSFSTPFNLLRGPWPLVAGAVGLAVLNGLTLLLAGHPWSITWAFSLWGGKVLQGVGFDLSQTTFWRGAFQQRALEAPILADITSVMDIGIVLGAGLAAGLAGRFAPVLRISWRTVGIALVGGVLLGYGARIAYGCNIGAYFSGVASTSLHGWLWLAGALLGTPVGVRSRAALERGR